MADEPASRLKTLIVDDEPLAVERMQVICAKMGELQVVGTASDGAQALRLIEALEPDLVLLDMTMPEVDGMSVAKALTDKAQSPAIVFVTAHDNYAVEAFDLEAVDYVLKPGRQAARARSRRRSTSARSGSASRELIRHCDFEVGRIDAERDYVRFMWAGMCGRTCCCKPCRTGKRLVRTSSSASALHHPA